MELKREMLSGKYECVVTRRSTFNSFGSPWRERVRNDGCKTFTKPYFIDKVVWGIRKRFSLIFFALTNVPII